MRFFALMNRGPEFGSKERLR